MVVLMHVISFVAQKGGTGKSHLAISFAVAAEAAGERVCILDLDPQSTVAEWYEGRSAETPAVLNHNEAANLDKVLSALGDAGFTLVVIDTPGTDSHGPRGAMKAANLNLVVVRPSEADLKATKPTIAALIDMGQPFALVINQASPNKAARLTSAVNTRLSTSGMVVPVSIAYRMDHQYAYAMGQGVHEYDPAGKAAQEIEELWAWTRKQLAPAKIIAEIKPRKVRAHG